MKAYKYTGDKYTGDHSDESYFFFSASVIDYCKLSHYKVKAL